MTTVIKKKNTNIKFGRIGFIPHRCNADVIFNMFGFIALTFKGFAIIWSITLRSEKPE